MEAPFFILVKSGITEIRNQIEDRNYETNPEHIIYSDAHRSVRCRRKRGSDESGDIAPAIHSVNASQKRT